MFHFQQKVSKLFYGFFAEMTHYIRPFKQNNNIWTDLAYSFYYPLKLFVSFFLSHPDFYQTLYNSLNQEPVFRCNLFPYFPYIFFIKDNLSILSPKLK